MVFADWRVMRFRATAAGYVLDLVRIRLPKPEMM
jgi:hypothetical protein